MYAVIEIALSRNYVVRWNYVSASKGVDFTPFEALK